MIKVAKGDRETPLKEERHCTHKLGGKDVRVGMIGAGPSQDLGQMTGAVAPTCSHALFTALVISTVSAAI